mmetsp:Transcript_7880/g.19335  ORF Transcript_7880/g.19335 Transcript_7880/m.19335 type:complete len:462 (-) Transcript_7880:378-1763(-)|eukprot:CAMPEP_0116088864 /NCGR_PEP_ID=MMETSP0327-20121206/6106_1 /TAXON_ID=44447 /ORGANISM="Pseudo-nitzschia delicatissima, Strain B596" /LENGTH=461 /DNA_ID=CAMNT_0003579991 /DNA_START=45 /DNA_END=1430 /DNA_ORIENTATION=+
MAKMSSRYRRSRLSSSLPQAPLPSTSASTATSSLIVLIAGFLFGATAFTTFPNNPLRTLSYQQWLSSERINSDNRALFSSVGDDGGSGGGDDKDDNDLGDFLDPMKKPDSEDMKRAREYMSETKLPISFDDITGAAEEVPDEESVSSDAKLSPESSSMIKSSNATSSALFGGSDQGKGPSPSLLAKNPYMQVVSKISPSDLIAKFTAESDPRVQEAVRTTILGLIGSLPKLAFETTSVITGQRLASLMFQLQMTGYMFKNAEYRLSMSQSLGMSSNLLLAGVEDEDDPLMSGKIKGKLKIKYGKKNKTTEDSADEKTEDGMEIEVDAAAYMSELRDEVSRLKEELTTTKESKDEALQKDLLLYIRTLPAQELKSLTNTMSQDVLVCMKGLVQAVLAGIGDGKIGPDTVTEQSGEAMAQLCMWQLAVGYNLRELEVREEMKNNINALMGGVSEDDFEPGAFE